MTEYLDIEGGRIAYERDRQRPAGGAVARHRRPPAGLPVPGPELAQAGYRVASADLRGHGESSMGWDVHHPHRYRG